MEVLAMSDYFHDPEVQWTGKMEETGFTIIIGSKRDRIQIVLTAQEMQQICGTWTSSQFAQQIAK